MHLNGKLTSKLTPGKKDSSTDLLFFSPYFVFVFFLTAGGLFFVSLRIAEFNLNVTLEQKIMSSLRQNRQEQYELPLYILLLSSVLV